MRLISRGILIRVRRRLSPEGGFAMIVALGVLAVTTLLVGAAYIAVSGDAHQSQHDLEAKRAYYAARAGINTYLYQLNQNPSYWSTCSNDTQSTTSVPGSTTGEQYSYSPILANGSTSCTSDAITSLIDKTTGTLRMKFIGYAGSPQVQRGIIVSFRKASPFDYLWYTVYEALDSSISGFSGCGVFYRNGRSSSCNIFWVTGDAINGPMYTQDQYLISGSPTFGRNSSDPIKSAAPGTSASNICSGNNCGALTLKGTALPGQPTISPPSDNSGLLTDATSYGKVYSGTTTITLSGTTATVKNCPSSCTTTTVDITQYPIIYVSNGSGCSPYTYSPFSVTYSTTGCTGDVYISGNYTSPLTVAAANNIIINGNITTTETSGLPSGSATLGLVANQFIRVMHGCSSNTNVSTQTFSNLKIDAAVLSLQHSFIVDNYNCGAALGDLTVNGAIAQYFRGAVGTGSNSTGYLKAYTYDDRLKVLLPPYLFDIATAQWHPSRETLCVPGGSGSSAC